MFLFCLILYNLLNGGQDAKFIVIRLTADGFFWGIQLGFKSYIGMTLYGSQCGKQKSRKKDDGMKEGPSGKLQLPMDVSFPTKLGIVGVNQTLSSQEDIQLIFTSIVVCTTLPKRQGRSEHRVLMCLFNHVW